MPAILASVAASAPAAPTPTPTPAPQYIELNLEYVEMVTPTSDPNIFNVDYGAYYSTVVGDPLLAPRINGTNFVKVQLANEP